MTKDVPQVDPKETAKILELAESTLDHSGDWVEFGCYRGDTSILLAKLLQEHHSLKQLWLYDSFTGLPGKSIQDLSATGDHFQSGALTVTKRFVSDRFRHANLPTPIIKKAFFNELNPSSDLPKTISFAFLDGDFYNSIRTSFSLITPRLTPDSIIVIHDYNNPQLPGSTRAVDEWLAFHRQLQFKNCQTLRPSLSIFHTLAIIGFKAQ